MEAALLRAGMRGVDAAGPGLRAVWTGRGQGACESGASPAAARRRVAVGGGSADAVGTIAPLVRADVSAVSAGCAWSPPGGGLPPPRGLEGSSKESAFQRTSAAVSTSSSLTTSPRPVRRTSSDSMPHTMHSWSQVRPLGNTFSRSPCSRTSSTCARVRPSCSPGESVSGWL